MVICKQSLTLIYCVLRDALGCTPFMAAVRIRAYSAAVKLYDTATYISTEGGTDKKKQWAIYEYDLSTGNCSRHVSIASAVL